MTHGRASRDRSVTVSALARVEGEGGLEVVVRDGKVTDARLNIYEPPRFFEALLRGRRYTEPLPPGRQRGSVGRFHRAETAVASACV